MLPALFVRRAFQHKEKLAVAARLPEQEVLEALHTLVTYLEFFNEANIPAGTWMEAYRLCRPVDEKDTPYIALALYLDAALWTDDAVLKSGLRAAGYDRFY